MATYKNFTLNEPGDAPPWGATEYQAWQDLIDTVIEDAVDEKKKTTGHKHYKMYEQTSGALALTILDSGTGKFISGDFAIQNNLGRFSVETYSTTITDTSLIYLRHSHHGTVETVAATGNGEVLGEIQFQGVSNVPAFDTAAAIRSTQVGATDSQIGADMAFYVAEKGGSLINTLTMDYEKITSALKKFGFGKTTLENWNTDLAAVQIAGSGSIYGKTGEAEHNDIGLACNYYQEVGNVSKRMFNDKVSRYYQSNGLHIWYANAAGLPDVEFIPTERMRLTAYDLAEESAQLGLGTSAPMSNVASAAGDFTGDGIHIKSDITNDRQAFLILEGDSLHTNGMTHAATSIIFADNNPAVGDDKLLQLRTYGQNMSIRTLNDDISPGISIVTFGVGGSIFNPGSADIDFIVTDDGGDPVIYGDAGLGYLGVGAIPSEPVCFDNLDNSTYLKFQEIIQNDPGVGGASQAFVKVAYKDNNGNAEAAAYIKVFLIAE